MCNARTETAAGRLHQTRFLPQGRQQPIVAETYIVNLTNRSLWGKLTRLIVIEYSIKQ